MLPCVLLGNAGNLKRMNEIWGWISRRVPIRSAAEFADEFAV